ncbi:MAG: amidohydrolase family protein [Anaerolineae bacterium]
MRLVWLDELPLINVPTLPDSVPVSGTGWTVDKIVFVQADVIPEQAIVETEWAVSLAAQDARIRAIVAYVPLEKGAAESRAWLDRLKVFPMVRGIRRCVEAREAGLLTQPDFIAGVKLLPGYQYTFDLCAPAALLGDVIQLVQACPEVQFVLDHGGNPNIAAKALDPWRAQMTTLAALPNVRCKLSGLVTNADPLNWTPPDLPPYIDHLLSTFGVDRLMFGSDSPVLRLARSTYASWVDVAVGALKALSPADLQRVFADNAAAFYRI